MLLYQILAYNIHGKIQETHTKSTNLKYQIQCCLMDHVLYGHSSEISVYHQKTVSDNPSKRVNVNKIERII